METTDKKNSLTPEEVIQTRIARLKLIGVFCFAMALAELSFMRMHSFPGSLVYIFAAILWFLMSLSFYIDHKLIAANESEFRDFMKQKQEREKQIMGSQNPENEQ